MCSYVRTCRILTCTPAQAYSTAWPALLIDASLSFNLMQEEIRRAEAREGIEQVVRVRFVPEFTGGEQASVARMRQLYFLFLADT